MVARSAPKVRRPRSQVEPLVREVRLDLTARRMNGGPGFAFAGSWRRGRSEIGDLDLLLLTPELDLRLLPERLRVGWYAGGPARMHTVDPETGVQVDIWAVPPGTEGPFLWFATGPHDLNIAMRSWALRRGKSLSQYGVFDVAGDEKVRIDDGTEPAVAEALGRPWIPPTERDRWKQAWGRASSGESVKVPASDGGEPHTLSRDDLDGSLACTCRGFTYRRRCKHTDDPERFGLKPRKDR